MPGLEALEKMRALYTDKGIDILKDAVSHPGVSLHYLLRGSIERGAKIYSPCKEDYGMLKEAVGADKAWCSHGITELESRVSDCTVSENQKFVRESSATMPTRYICQRCWETCLRAKERLCITRESGRGCACLFRTPKNLNWVWVWISGHRDPPVA